MQKKVFVYHYKHKKPTDYLYKIDPTDYLFIQGKDTITAFVLLKNEKIIKKIEENFIKAQVLVFKFFVKEKIYHKIIIEKLKEDKKK